MKFLNSFCYKTSLFTLLISVVLFWGCSSETTKKLEFGDTAPAFKIVDLNEKTIDLATMLGQPVILRFFVPNCKYCRADTKVFNKYHSTYSEKGLNIIYINTDQNESEAKKFVNDLNIVFPVVLDSDQKLAQLYRVKVVPQTIVLDPSHSIIGAILGGVSEAELNELLLKFIN